ncbi:MAG TPA: four helix bundle protein [candidate division Zixibacteria bacterium]|jgi:four helix bundle protein|nr:four helix bundle protein [candidate division Zixibacteria bacterium]
MGEDFDQTDIFQLALELTDRVYDITASFPKEELYNLVSQCRRSVVSICGNIAEGHGRYTFKERIQFSTYARGSLFETKSYMIISKRRGYISEDRLTEYLSKHRNLSVKLNNNMRSPRKNVP